MKSSFPALLFSTVLVLSSVRAQSNPICQWIQETDAPTVYGPYSNVTFSPQSAQDADTNVLQTAFIPDAVDSLGLHRSIDFLSITNYRDNPSTIITLHEKLLPSNPADAVGFTEVKVAITDEFGTNIFRVNRTTEGTEYTCDLVIAARRNLQSVGIGFDELNNEDTCGTPTPADLQDGKWNAAITGTFNSSYVLEKGQIDEQTLSLGNVDIADTSVEFSVSEFDSQVMSNINFTYHRELLTTTASSARILVTATSDDIAATKLQYILPGGYDSKAYKCGSVFSQTQNNVTAITFQTEIV